MMQTSNSSDACKYELCQIFLRYFHFVSDLRDFILNTKLSIHKSKEHRIKIEPTRYEQYSLEQISHWDMQIVMEMSLVKIFSWYEDFLKDYFKKLFKIDKKYSIVDRVKSGTNIIIFSENLRNTFDIDLPAEYNDWNGLKESYYRRNAIVHNKGKVSDHYMKYILHGNSSTRHQRLSKIDPGYMNECTNNIRSFFEFIHKHITNFFGFENIGSTLIELSEQKKYSIPQSFMIKFSLNKKARI